MKKLLSICFLSILLGLLSFSAQAQNCGFLIKNLQPDTVEGVVQMSPDGLLPLDHTLGHGVFINPDNPIDYYGNANVGRTELYKVYICNTCGLDPKTKVSLDWILQRQNDNGEWVTVNDNLSNYAEFDIYTLYREINSTTGECNRISWLGGRVPNGFGYCEQAVAPDMFHGITCNTPTNYPGALPVGQGTPYSVMNSLGELIPAMGMTPIYTEALDYFYLDFFSQTENYIQIKWKYAGNYRLIMNLRQRVGGTAWNNLTWNDNETTDFIGGHQSCCGEILMSDTLTYPSWHEFSKEICETDQDYMFGSPAYAFHVTMPDTNVVFGHTLNPGTGDCSIFNTDSLYRFHFFVRHTPQVVVLKPADTLCKCTAFGEEQLLSMISYDSTDLEYSSSHKFMWYYSGGWHEEMPNIDTVVGTYYYTVLQVNTYNNFFQFYSDQLDTIVCTGDPVTISVTFVEMTPPVLPANIDICLETIDSNTVLTLVSEPDANCANTTKWYTNARYVIPGKPGYMPSYNDYFTNHIYAESILDTTNELAVNLIDYVPSINKDTVLYFFATSYSEDRDCESKTYSFMTVTIHQTPVLSKVLVPNQVNCPGSTVTMSVNVSNNPADTDPAYNYHWSGNVTDVMVNGATATVTPDSTYTIGTSGTTQTDLPFDANKKYNYSQQIYPKAKIGAGEITKISFNYNGGAYTESGVKIYLGTTTMDTYHSTAAFREWADKGTLVYDGNLELPAAAGWVDIQLQHPYVYDATNNLVVTIEAMDGNKVATKYFKTSSATRTALRYMSDTKFDPATVAGSAATVRNYRNDIKIFVQDAGIMTNNLSDTATYQINPQDTCGTSYMTSVYVIDGNGCQSQPVSFTYTSNDTIAPTITGAPTYDTINACNLNVNDVIVNPVTTVAALQTRFNITVTDNCDMDLLTLSYSDDTTHVTDTTCEEKIVRTYKVTDHCGNFAQYVHTIVAHDQNAPYFNDPMTHATPYIRMIPARGMNCTYDAPSKAAFVHEILNVVFDNCTEMDSLWLMDHAEFYWQNSEWFDSVKAPGTKDLFGHHVGNQLTVTVYVEDKCGNQASASILYFQRPDTLLVGHPSITVDPANICLGDTATLTFDSTMVTFDPDFGVASPMSFEWSNLESEVEFSDTNAVVTTVSPATGDKYYHFKVTVTDAYGCKATSEYATLYVKANPNVKIVKDIRNGATEPYCPTYGVMTIEAVDAVTGTKIPNLAYTWSGESVNVNESIEDTSFISIIPTLCDHVYDAHVHVIDTVYGCVGDASITVWVADTAGPVYTGDLINDTVARQAGCKMYVPDFIHYLNNSNITDNCYPFSAFKDSFRQVPAEGTEMTEDVAVTIYVTTPCDDNEYAITGKFFARVPDNMLTVTAAAVPTEDCDPATFTFTATPNKGIAPINFVWTKTNSTWTDNGQTVTNVDTVVAGATSSTYNYKVTATDAMGCKATASVNVTVNQTITDIDTLIFPNRNCSAPWSGQLVIVQAPIGMHYELENASYYAEISTEVPGFDPNVPITDRVFDYLQEGNYELIVTTSKGCVSHFPVYIPGATPTITFNGEVTPHDPTFCTNNNGYITIDAEPGYTYEVFSAAGLLIPSPYTGLGLGTYTIVKTHIQTRCVATTTVDINASTTSKTFTVTSQANTLCGDVNYNGKVAFTNTGWNYTVTTVPAGTVIYTGLATTLDTLAEGDYNVAGVHIETGCEYNKTVTVANGRNNPVFTATPSKNHYCDNVDGIVDGKISLSPSTWSYTVTDEAGDVVTNLNALAAGDYHVVALNVNNGCSSAKDVTITNDRKNPTFTVAQTENASCDPTVMAYNGTATITITNTNSDFIGYIKNYSVVFDGQTYSDIASTTKTISGLNSGTYDFTVISKYLCEAQGQIKVEQHVYPALAMHATPNTMCVGTFEHPGNGTIVMDNPYRQPNYDFSYYYSTDTYEAGTQLQVNYFDPLSYTMYHLIDSLYYVLVYDNNTGCSLHDTITVPLGRDHVVATATSTPNKNCKAPFDGTVTVTATAYKLATPELNVDAVLAYQLVGGSYVTAYQLNPTFVGVPDGTFTVNVKDTTTGCVYTFDAAVTVDKTPIDFVITPTVSNNHACNNPSNPNPTPWDGAISITASSAMFPTAQFVYSFNGGDFSTTNSWTGLAPGDYPIVVKDTVSGCDSTVTVHVGNDNICAPVVSIESFNHNNKPFHFCLNTPDAMICASATTNSECPTTDFSYQWHVDCHDLNYTGSCINIPTDEVHCCTYTVTVTSLATGCQTVESRTVCIDRIHTIEYLVNDVPFLDNPRIAYNCVNKDIRIGIKPNGWAHAWWTNAHTTPMPSGDPEYRFWVYANTNKADSLYSYCVNVIDTNGCRAQGVINLWSYPLPTTTVYDTACTQFVFGGNTYDYVAADADANGYVHYEFTETTIGGGMAHGCDSITIHKVTLLGDPTITGTVATSFCEGTTVAEAIQNLVIEHAIDTIIRINGTEVQLTDVLTYNNCVPDWMSVTAVSGTYGGTNSCTDHARFNFVVSKAPKFTATSLNVLAEYCATGMPSNPIAFPAHQNNTCVASGVNFHLYVFDTDNSVFADLGTVTEDMEMPFIPRLAYDGKKLALVATNLCGSDTIYGNLDVDSTVIKLTNREFCQDDAIDFDAMLGKHYDPTKVTAWLLYDAADPTPTTINASVDYVASEHFTSNSALDYNEGEVYPINDYLSFTTKKNGGSQTIQYFTNNNGHFRMYYDNSAAHNGNQIKINPVAGAAVTGISFNALSTAYAPAVNIDGTVINPVGTAYTAAVSTSPVIIKNVGTSQLRFGAMTINYTAPAAVPTISGGYKMIQYVPGQELSMLENGAKIFFVVNDGACAPVLTDTITLTVNPKPTVAFNSLDHDLCIGDAVTALNAALDTANVASCSWQYKESASATSYTNVDNTAALVNAIKDMSEAQIAFYVENPCGNATAYATVRILDAPTMSITGSPVLVCNDATLAQVLAGVTITTDPGNYDASELELVYTVGSYTLNNLSEVGTYITSGGNITVTYQPKSGVKDCGHATGTIKVNFKASTFTDPTYKEACDGQPLSAFIDQAPSWTGTDAVVDQYWMVNDEGASGSYYDHRVTDSYIIDYSKMPDVWYVWETECGHVEQTSWYHLYDHINRAPEVSVYDNLTTCEGTTITVAQTGLSVTYHGNDDKYTNVWTIDGNPFDFSTVLTAAQYDGKKLVITLDYNGQACGVARDTITLHVNPIPVPYALGDTVVCTDGTANLSVENPSASSSYAWFYGTTQIGNTAAIEVHFGEVTGDPTKATISTSYATITVNKTLLYQFRVVETANTCSSVSMVNASNDPYSLDVITVKVDNAPKFIFRDMNNNITHHINGADGNNFTYYTWEVDTMCTPDDILVWVDFTIYHNGHAIPNDSIGEYILTQELASVTGGSKKYWVTSDSIHWTSADQTKEYSKIFHYNSSIHSTNSSDYASTNHFPNASLFTGNTNVYSDVYLHFLYDLDPVKKAIAPFLVSGEYTIVYRLLATDNNNYYTNNYFNHTYGTSTMFIGGQNPFVGNITVLSVDSITISVNTPYVPSTTPDVADDNTPDLAPTLNVNETVVPDMEVWPNPAPTVTTTLKARVHNLSGIATVTLTTLTGKQVYKGDIYIDNDNYYFEFNVNSLSVGSYIMTVRTATDVITKKIIVTTLAR